MLPAVDYRTQYFGLVPIATSGKFLGRRLYWKLYAVENSLRAIVASILRIELGPNWWATVTDTTLRKKIAKVRSDYLAKPVHNSPGAHDIYYVFLPDLTKIILENSDQFRPTMPDIDQWVVKLENIRLPRNLVGHMNWPNAADITFIETTYREIKHLVYALGKRGLDIQVP